MVKTVFIFLLVIYITVVGIWCYRFQLSYILTNRTNHDLVLDHDFTNAEREGLKEAFHIRQLVSSILLYSSILLATTSYVILRKQLIRPAIIVRIAMIVSCLFAIVLLLANGINFIPGPPIR